MSKFGYDCTEYNSTLLMSCQFEEKEDERVLTDMLNGLVITHQHILASSSLARKVPHSCRTPTSHHLIPRYQPQAAIETQNIVINHQK